MVKEEKFQLQQFFHPISVPSPREGKPIVQQKISLSNWTEEISPRFSIFIEPSSDPISPSHIALSSIRSINNTQQKKKNPKHWFRNNNENCLKAEIFIIKIMYKALGFQPDSLIILCFCKVILPADTKSARGKNVYCRYIVYPFFEQVERLRLLEFFYVSSGSLAVSLPCALRLVVLYSTNHIQHNVDRHRTQHFFPWNEIGRSESEPIKCVQKGRVRVEVYMFSRNIAQAMLWLEP